MNLYMFLFYQLAISKDQTTTPAVKQLKQVRVMKLYNPILDFVADLHESTSMASGSTEFNKFVEELITRELIRTKIKRYD